MAEARFSGLFGGLITHRKRWDTFNASHGKRLLKKPSPFARWVSSEYPSDRGSSTSAAAAAATRGCSPAPAAPVIGVDYTLGAVMRAQPVGRARAPNASFEPLNFYDTRAALAMGVRLSREDGPVDVYARFVLHALEDLGA